MKINNSLIKKRFEPNMNLNLNLLYKGGEVSNHTTSPLHTSVEK